MFILGMMSMLLTEMAARDATAPSGATVGQEMALTTQKTKASTQAMGVAARLQNHAVLLHDRQRDFTCEFETR